MSRIDFKASVQYGDWHGTVAADEYGDGTNSLDKLFQAAGVDQEREIVIAVEFYADEEDYFAVRGYVHPVSSSTDGGWIPSLAHDFSRNGDPINVRKVDVKLTREQFFKHFKRFNVMLVHRGLENIIERDGNVTND